MRTCWRDAIHRVPTLVCPLLGSMAMNDSGISMSSWTSLLMAIVAIVDLVGGVAPLLKVLMRFFSKAGIQDARHQQPPFIFIPVS